MTWWSGRRRKLDRADKVQVFIMLGLFVIGVGFLGAAVVRSFFGRVPLSGVVSVLGAGQWF